MKKRNASHDPVGNYPDEDSLCICICPPETGNFKRGEYYQWSYIIDGFYATDKEGNKWDSDEIGFISHFTIIDKNKKSSL